MTKVFQFFSSFLGSKKLIFVNTTELASECTWKTHVQPRRMRLKTFQYKHLTLTYGIFQVNRNTFPEFPEILSQHFLTFHSFLVANYSRQASFQRNWVLFTAFSFLCACGIVSAGPSGHLKQSIQKTLLEQRSTLIRWRALMPNNLFRNCPNIVLTSICNLEHLIFQATPKLWSISENIEKPSSMKQLWTTLADRRRAGPPAFRRKYRQKPYATLSFSLGGRLFLREFWQSRRG